MYIYIYTRVNVNIYVYKYMYIASRAQCSLRLYQFSSTCGTPTSHLRGARSMQCTPTNTNDQ